MTQPWFECTLLQYRAYRATVPSLNKEYLFLLFFTVHMIDERHSIGAVFTKTFMNH